MNEWTPKRLHPDSIRDSIRIGIVAADSIRDLIRTKISDSQVRKYMRKSWKCIVKNLVLDSSSKNSWKQTNCMTLQFLLYIIALLVL